MLVYRVSKTKYAADLKGEGARLWGGRWNHRMVGCLYTSESRALAILEYTVNISLDDIPRALSLVTIDIPDQKIMVLKESALPGDWKSIPAPSSTKDFGSDLLLAADQPVIKIPSAVLPSEYNYLLNPRHAESEKFKIKDIADFVYDVRIKQS
ncbi:RES family NAD+ phosphorylase [Niabella insulamsoli]|uniref:RES family NAD+ phosphorylase n=1 Tax=Niabella insulamsoli TaxID=3144874 RepID=UPI0031FC1D16